MKDCDNIGDKMNTQLIVVTLNTAGQHGNRHTEPETIKTPHDIRPTIQQKFDTVLRGIAGYVLVFFNGRLWQCERNSVEPNKPYIRNEITYHPLATKFKLTE